MSGVIALGYIGWEVSDIPAWEDLMCEVFGLELRTDALDNTRHYRVDARHHRISLYPGKQDRVRYLKFGGRTVGFDKPRSCERVCPEPVARH